VALAVTRDNPLVTFPSDDHVKLWYQQHYNAGFFGLLSFMGLDSAEVEAQGWTVRAADGREFIDCVGGYGSYNFGHRHPRIVAAVAEQLQRMPMSSKLLLNGQLAALCHELAQAAPGELTHTFVSNSGTEAVEAAIKLARLATHKHGVITATNAFHGKTLGSLSGTHREAFQQPFTPLLEHFGKVPFGDLDALEAAITDDTACVMLEPVQGEGGIILAPDGYLRGAREITRKRGVLLVLDEVQTGMGRCGFNFAGEREDVDPDIMVLAKSLGGGVMPIGATMGTAAVWNNFEQNPLAHTSTFGGNELACAAARAALAVLVEDNLARQAAVTGAHFLAGLHTLKEDYGDLIAEVRGVGLMIGIDMVSSDVSQLFIAYVLQLGVLIAFALNKPGVIRIEPPLIMDTATVDEVLKRLRQALEDTRGVAQQYGLIVD
jgi:putrescine aminotransferase